MNNEQDNQQPDRLPAELAKLGKALDGVRYPGRAWNGPQQRQPRRTIRVFAGVLTAAAAVLIVLSIVMNGPEQPARKHQTSAMTIPAFKMNIPAGFDTQIASRAGGTISPIQIRDIRIPKTQNVFQDQESVKSRFNSLTIPTFTMPSRQERKQNHDTQNHSDAGAWTRSYGLSVLDRHSPTQG